MILDGRACHRLKRAAASCVDSEDESEVDSQNPDVSNDSEDDEDLDIEGHGDPFSFSQAYGGVSSLMRSTAPDFSATAARVENACDTMSLFLLSSCLSPLLIPIRTCRRARRSLVGCGSRNGKSAWRWRTSASRGVKSALRVPPPPRVGTD